MTSAISTIDASPTKEFFIDMLVRDVPLGRAIIDLVDNSVDGANRCSIATSELRDFWVRLEFSAARFRISDNCGGIPVEVARDYAFRFGRPSGTPNTAGAIGQFGVGMKRSIFKLGQEFRISSTTATSRFTVHHDVNEWKRDEKDWNFEFASLNDGENFEEGECGTTLEVTQLHESVAQQFVLDGFAKRLSREIETAHSLVLERGLVISINGIPLGQTTLSLLQSEILKPASLHLELRPTGSTPVQVRIVAGVSGERSYVKGGWYVFCNGRLVLGADQSEMTGWEVGESDDSDVPTIPKYHPDFAYFRGYVFFDSDDPSLLPWTTTKTGVDVDSPVYKSARLEMMRLLRPVLDFLRRLAAEKSAKESGEQKETPLGDAVHTAEEVSHNAVSERTSFSSPPPAEKKAKKRTTQRIQYDAEKVDIARVKARLNVTSLRHVGESTFSYFLEAECND